VNGRWELAIDSPRPLFRVEARLDVQVRHLGQGVNASVGSPRAVELEIADPFRPLDRLPNLPLDGASVFLNLPAAIARPQVLQVDLEPRHARIRSPPYWQPPIHADLRGSVLLRRKSFAAWKEFLFADSLRSLRLGGECGTALSPRRREGRKENAKKTNLVAARLLQVNRRFLKVPPSRAARLNRRRLSRDEARGLWRRSR